MAHPSNIQAPVAYPLAFGHWHVRKDTLECRLPRKTVAVTAPGELLGEVLRLCDGRLAWKEVAAALCTHWARAPVDAFLAQLLQEGALVEASEALARWTELGQLPLVHRRIALPEELPELPAVAQRRLLTAGAAPLELPGNSAPALADLLRRRESHRTFADAPVTASQLAAILWAAHGVARSAVDPALGWHRTIASGGNMHSVRWFVVVLRDLPGETNALSPGLYEARFHLEGGATFDLLEASTDAAWRILRDPRVLSFASALILPLCDASVPARKYGNRATLFAQIEVGQSLQNAQLMATALGVAAMVRGDTASEAVLGALSPHLHARPDATATRIALPSLVAGALPTSQQVAEQKNDRVFDVGAGVTLDKRRFAFTAGPIRVGAAALYASGRSADPREALRKAEAEAWERLAWASPEIPVEGPQREVKGALDPSCLVAYAPDQYRSAAFPFRPFSARRRYFWKAAIDAHSGEQVHVPAECVYALAALPPRQRRSACTSTSTSGVAAWTDAEGALCRATLELLERDAFLRCWLRRESRPLITFESLPTSLRQRAEALQAAGHRVAICMLPACVPVISVFLQGTTRPFTAITAAASFDPEAALAKALDEGEGRAAHASAFPARPLGSPDRVFAIEDANRYYQSPRYFRASDFYAASDRQVAWRGDADAWCQDWGALQGRLADHRLRLLAADLTPAGAAIDQGRTPLRVIRALIPGLLPIWFQSGFQPAGLPAFREGLAMASRRTASRTFIHPFT